MEFIATVTQTIEHSLSIDAYELRAIAKKQGATDFPAKSEDWAEDISEWLDENPAVLGFVIEAGEFTGVDSEVFTIEL